MPRIFKLTPATFNDNASVETEFAFKTIFCARRDAGIVANFLAELEISKSASVIFKSRTIGINAAESATPVGAAAEGAGDSFF